MASPHVYRNRIAEKGYDSWGLTISSIQDANKALNDIKSIEKDLFVMKKEIKNEISIIWDNYREQTKDSFGNALAGAILGKKRTYRIRKKAREKLAEERDNLIATFREVESILDDILKQHNKNKMELRDYITELKTKNKQKRNSRDSYNNRSNSVYEEYIKSQEWREKAEEAKAKAGNRCQVCNRSRAEVQLDAHHRTYERLGNELPEDITVLCRDCHQLYEDSKKLISKAPTEEVSATGFCIRCKKTIKLDPQSPYCYTCFKVWKRFENSEYEENYCHICGEENVSTMQKPACYGCFKINRQKLTFQKA